MYNTTPFINLAIFPGALLMSVGVIALSVILVGKKPSDKKARRGAVVLAGLLLVLSVGHTAFFGYKAIRPDVAVYEGRFSRCYDTNTSILRVWRQEYMFDDQVAFINYTGSLDRIYPEGLVEGQKYRITYDKQTEIILEIKALTDQS